MSWSYRILAVLLCAVGLFAGGYWAGRGQREVVIQERVVKGETKVVTVEKIRWKERIVRPDGTIIEREREEDRDTGRTERETTVDRDEKSRPILASYSLGVRYWAPISSLTARPDFSMQSLELTAGRRILGELWVDAGYRLDRSLSLGVRMQF